MCPTLAELDDCLGGRFPMIALKHLLSARQGLPVPRSANPKKHRYNKRRMQVVEDAVVSIIAAAAGVEAEILCAALFVHEKLRELNGEDCANCFAKMFAMKDRVPIIFGCEFRSVAAKELHKLARKLTEAFGAEPVWPDTNDLTAQRDRFMHRTVHPCRRSPRPEFRVMEDEDVGSLVEKATNLFDVMNTCVASLFDLHSRLKSKRKLRAAISNMCGSKQNCAARKRKRND